MTPVPYTETKSLRIRARGTETHLPRAQLEQFVGLMSLARTQTGGDSCAHVGLSRLKLIRISVPAGIELVTTRVSDFASKSHIPFPTAAPIAEVK